jgi:cardiolipin synthase
VSDVNWRPHIAWAAGLTVAGATWYAMGSLAHRREQRHGYELRGGELAVGSPEYLRAAEALTSAPISGGNDLEVLVNGDRIFPVFLDTIRAARKTVNLET